MTKPTLKELAKRKSKICQLPKILNISKPVLYKIFKFDKSCKLIYLQKIAKLLNIKIIISKDGVDYET